PGLRQCPHWVKSRHRIASTPRPLYPQKRTSRNTVGMSALCQKRTSARYSIISSARPISVLGTVRPNAFPVFRLIASSYLVGACTGRSAGFSPLRMRSTELAARRYWSTRSGSIRDQAAFSDEAPIQIDRRQFVASCKRDDQTSVYKCQRTPSHDQPTT